jgi:hypothetical protein
MKPIVKKSLAAIAAAGALASVVAGRERPSIDVVQPAARIETRMQGADDIDLARLEQRAGEAARETQGADPFAPRNFSPIVPAQAQASRAKEKPVPPPLPFRYIGKLLDGDKLAIFLSRGDESLSVAAGDTVGEYRVDRITDTEISFTYLPLKTKQSLPL